MKVLVNPSNSKILNVTDDSDNIECGFVLSNIIRVGYVNVNSIPNFEIAASNKRQNLYIVNIVTEEGTFKIPLGSANTEGTTAAVVNQPTWTNTLAGAKKAVEDILSWIP